MISSDDSSGERSASQSVFFCILLLILAGLPAFVGIVTYAYEANRASTRCAIRRCGDAFFAPAHAERCAFTVHRIDRLSSIAVGGFGSDEIMNATSDLMSNYFTKLQANPVVSAVHSGEHVVRLSVLCRMR